MAGGKGNGKGKKCKDKKKRNDKKRLNKFEPRSLPDDAITEILLRFPVKSVLRFRSVSKVWCAKIDSPEFKKKHQSYQRVRYDDAEFLVVNRQYSVNSGTFGCKMNVLSCYDDYKSLSDLKSSSDLDINSMYFSSFSYTINGIVCFIRDPGCDLYLCNPALGEFRKLPEFPRFPDRLGITASVKTSAVGIGFDDAADDYVVVKFVHDSGDSDSHVLKCVSYHVKTESWSKIDIPTALVSAYASPLKERYSSTKLYASFFSHGCIHWCMDWRHMILTLNTNTRSFQEIQFPNAWKGYSYDDYVYLLKCDSFSSIALVGFRGRDLHNIDIWVMKEYGVADSWTKQYSISDYTIPGLPPSMHGLPRISRPLCFWRKDKVFLLSLCGKLICYDVGKGQMYDPPLRGQCDPSPHPYAGMKAMKVLSGGQEKLLFLPDVNYVPPPPPPPSRDTLSLPHPNMGTLELVTCSGSDQFSIHFYFCGLHIFCPFLVLFRWLRLAESITCLD